MGEAPAPQQAEPQLSEHGSQISVEEYKHLNEEIMFLIKDTRSLEQYVLGGVVAYYAWVLLNIKSVSTPWIGLSPIAAIVFGVWRSITNFDRMLEISEYMQQRAHFVEAGWERRIRDIRDVKGSSLSKWIVRHSFAGFWVLLLLFALCAWWIALGHPPYRTGWISI